ncbi:MAG: condensation domain-containing protein, partial [Bacteroidota bacterium]
KKLSFTPGVSIPNTSDQIAADNFFALGGDSIMAIRVVAGVKKQSGKSISVVDLFKHPTIATLSNQINDFDNGSDKNLYEAMKLMEETKKDVISSSDLTMPISDAYPMSDVETGMVYHSMLNEDQAVYHDQFVYNLSDDQFDLKLLEKAMTLMVQKHSMLRTAFNLDDFKVPVQIEFEYIDLPIDYTDITDINGEDQNVTIAEFLKTDRTKPFDFSKAPLWRMQIYKTTPDNVAILWIFHHSILDGWSVASLMTELNNTYRELRIHEGYQPEPIDLNYKDYVVQELVAKNDQRHKDFWRDHLAGATKLTLKDINIKEGADQTQNVRKKLSQETFNQLESAVLNEKVRIQEICFTAYLYAIHMIGNRSDMIVGMVTNTRVAAEGGDKLLGCFLNTLPVRINLKRAENWRELLQLVKGILLDIRQHQQLPLPDIITEADEEVNSTGGLFNTIFDYTDFHIYNELAQKRDVESGMGSIADFSNHSYENTGYDLDFSLHKLDETLTINVNYAGSEFSQSYVEQFVTYFEGALELICKDSTRALSRNDLLSEEQKSQLLLEFNYTQVAYPEEDTFVDLFEYCVRQYPERVAAIHNDDKLSYDELNRYANRIAHSLISTGMQQGKIIALLLDR